MHPSSQVLEERCEIVRQHLRALHHDDIADISAVSTALVLHPHHAHDNSSDDSGTTIRADNWYRICTAALTMVDSLLAARERGKALSGGAEVILITV